MSTEAIEKAQSKRELSGNSFEGAGPTRKSEKHLDESHASEVPHNKRFPVWIWLGTIAISFLAGKFLELGHGPSSHSPQLPSQTSGTIPEGSLVVTTALATSRPVQRSVQSVGTLHGYEELVLSSKVEGRVTKIHYDLSAVVHPGDLLLELDDTDAKLAVLQAERNLETELAKWGFSGIPELDADVTQLPSVVSAKLRFDLARSRFNRLLKLEATKSISVDELEQARSEAEVADAESRNQILLANSAIATARLRAADLEIAKQRLRDCEIRVPTPTLSELVNEEFYTISERMVSEGTLLRPGTEVFRLVLGKSLKLRLLVPESNAAKVRTGQSVSVFIASSDLPEKGIVTNISPSIDRSTRTLLVEVTIPNENGRCRPGGFAKAKIWLGDTDEALTIPLEGVYALAGNQKVFMIENGVAREALVTLGEQTNQWVEITSPRIPAGTKIATSGQKLLSDGIAVVEREALNEEFQKSKSNTPSSEGSAPNASQSIPRASKSEELQ